MQTMKELDTQNLPGVEVKEVTQQTNEVVESLGNQSSTESSTQPSTETPKTIDDLVSRVSRVKVEEPVKQADDPFGLNEETFKHVTENPDLNKHYKSMLADYTA